MNSQLDRPSRFSEAERLAVYRAIAGRRDVRRGFLDRPLEEELLGRLLAAAHSAPSVGLMQPSRLIVVRDYNIRKKVHEVFETANRKAAASYSDERANLYSGLKLEGILEAPQNLCVLCDAGSGRGHGLGRQTMPETALYSTVCAIQNLWLAARSEGVGVGWVSILDPAPLYELLRIPDHLTLVAYLCLGYVESFAAEPDLERFGWETRMELKSVVSYDRYAEEPGR
ncbi:5,6-dimethylbenzimidazole synthase [Silvibacterium dinghuense]|uniref:5,6-dimethylbenzimidazole synthase n=1 Tax=Silvibacterium dinghuense TaxID=1560006 RepID=A0A4Q1SJR6_9BACT|nr:5,6-dimethylbenzimidazole synthase [Silvibacterium dinghuense]RXS97675.1 5,6-dimethylbenzimidazole synthase [Silvibacterium dinghuense]